MFDENEKIVDAFQHWFGIAIDSTQGVLEKLYLAGDPDVMEMYRITQQRYEESGVTHVILYRGCTETYGWEKVLCSWTEDEKLAKSYLTEVVRNGDIHEVICKVFPVKQILFDMGFVESYFEAIDDVMGMFPCDECIVIN